MTVFHFRRLGTELPYDARPAEWLGDSRLLFLEAKSLGRSFVGELYGSWDETLWIDISEEPPNTKKSIQHLRPDVYIELADNLSSNVDLTSLRKGIHDLNSFLRALQNKRVRGDQQDLYKSRANKLRAIRDYAMRFDRGVYCMTTGYQNVESSVIVRNPDFAGGGIDASERLLLQSQIEERNQQIRRTSALNSEQLKKKVEAFYASLGRKAPKLVVVANPITAAVAGAFATLLLENSNRSLKETNSQLEITKSLLSKLVSDAVISTAERATLASIDKTTDASIRAVVAEAESERFPWRVEAMRMLDLLGWFRRTTIAEIDISPTWIFDGKQIYDAIRAITPGFRTTRTIFDQQAELIEQIGEDLSERDSELQELLVTHVMNLLPNVLVSNINAISASFCRDHLGLKLPIYEKFSSWEQLAKEGTAFVIHEEFCIVSDFPKILSVDERNRLHSDSGPAIAWRDGWPTYYWHGIRIPGWIITSPEDISVESIQNEINQEIRRILITKYGESRYLIDSGAREIHRDQFGVLYRADIVNDESLSMVKVINSTMEPDGTYKEYFLRVPPGITKAKAAVAWTFGLEEDDYEPDVES